MTRNNLNDQLSWLLANIRLLTPNASSPPPIREPASSASSPVDETVFFTPTSELSPATRPNDFAAARSNPVLAKDSSYPSVATSISANASTLPGLASRGNQLDGPVTANMGRLVSKSSSKRPNLVFQQEHLPTPAPTAASGASLSSDYPAFLAKNSAKSRVPAHNASAGSRPEGASLTPRPTRSITRNVETVDLTTDGGSISTVFGSDTRVWREDFASRPEPITPSENSEFVFSSSKMVWREDYAVRPGPVSNDTDSVVFGSDVMVWEEQAARRPEPLSTKRGQKRKSDQISKPPTSSTDDFPDIMDLLSDDEVLQSSAKLSPTKSPARRRLKTSPVGTPSKSKAVIKSPSKSPSKLRVALAYDLPSVKSQRVELSRFKTPEKSSTSDKLELSQAKLDSLLLDSDSVFGSDVEHVSKYEAGPSRRVRNDTQVIQDSDEEIMTPPTYESLKARFWKPTVPLRSEISALSVVNTLLFKIRLPKIVH
ncbi:hypothetical protein RRF57_011169 [Xylaria bambusicola]|uniref:Uncharacterized protein n=1 Tax=Xylaria bambusicola TaxID=326684 RepID=A0AAN7UTF2_9PEZI